MRLKKWSFFVLLLFMIFVLTACEEKPSPYDALKNYTKLWTEQNFEKMYDMLSEPSKKSVSKEDFVNRYKKIYEDIGVKNLKVSPGKVNIKDEDLEKDTIKLPFTVKMDTIAGPVEFEYEASLVKEKHNDKENWYMNWNTTFIFPELLEGDKVRISITKGERGEIYDRNGLPLAMNGTAFEIGLVPEQMEGNEETIKSELSKLINVPVESINEKLNASWVKPNYFVPIKKVAKTEDELIQKAKEIPGVSIKEVSEREYPFGEATAHLIGYIGNITAEELEKNKDKGYTSSDRIGKRGLEELFEDRLRAKNGVKIYIEKVDGSEVVIAETKAENGETINLTIDAKLQKLIYEKMKGRTGTAAAIHPLTGEILALTSTPSFNPNDFVLGISSSKYKALEDNPEKPLINRFASLYAPGSAIKPIIGAIALEAGVITKDEKKKIEKKTWQPDKSWGGYHVTRVSDRIKEVHLIDALTVSDNIYFAMTGIDLGPERLKEGLEKFGFAEELKFPYPVSPSKISNSGDLQKGPLLADTSYGQGQMQMSILHLAVSYTPFINEGNMLLPILEKGKEKTIWKENVISKETAHAIAEGLKQVVRSPYGTARSAYMEDLVLAGKTGTAELKEQQGTKGKENGLFVAYNVEKPDLLIAMLIENVQTDQGSAYVVNKVKEIFRERR